MSATGSQHLWGMPDGDGVRACENKGCTVRVADSFRVWQRKPGAHWRRQNRELIPDCAGTGPAVVSAPEGAPRRRIPTPVPGVPALKPERILDEVALARAFAETDEQDAVSVTVDAAPAVTWEGCYAEFLRQRGVKSPCSRCQGLGTRSYGDTTTWRGGVGGRAITTDVCDQCWGTGDAHRKGADLRAMVATESQRIQERAAAFWAERTGVALSDVRPALREVATELERLGRSRRPRPEWFGATCRRLAQTLHDLVAAAERAAGGKGT